MLYLETQFNRGEDIFTLKSQSLFQLQLFTMMLKHKFEIYLHPHFKKSFAYFVFNNGSACDIALSECEEYWNFKHTWLANITNRV